MVPPARILCLSLFSVFCLNAPSEAQFNRYGGGLSFSTGIEEFDPDVFQTGNPGITLRGVYNFNKTMFLIPAASFYAPKKYSSPYLTVTTIYGHLNAHLGYKLAHQGPVMFYALAGGDLTNIYLSYNTDDPDYESGYIPAPGISLGTGVEMIIDQSFNAYTQVRYIVGKYQQLIISLGVHYYFEGNRYKSWR